MVTSLSRFWRAAPPSLDGSLIGCLRDAFTPQSGDWGFARRSDIAIRSVMRATTATRSIDVNLTGRGQLQEVS